MKKNTATWCTGLIAAVTLAMTFIQPTVIHQLVVWVSGLFAVVMVLALFVVGNWPQTEKTQLSSDETILVNVKRLRKMGLLDKHIATVLELDIDVIKAIP